MSKVKWYDTAEQLKRAADLFARVASNSKEEAFLKGYLMAHGAQLPNYNFELIGKDPELFIPIERSVEEIHEKIRKEEIEATKKLLREIYEKENRKIPDWLA